MSCGATATRCSRPGRSGRCSTSPRPRAASSRSWWRAAPRRTRSSRPCAASSARRGPTVVRPRGRSLGRRATLDVIRLLGRTRRHGPGAGRGHLPRRRARHRAPAANRARRVRARRATSAAHDRAAFARRPLPSSPAPHERGCRRAVSQDGRQPVLRDRGAGGGSRRDCPRPSATRCSPAQRPSSTGAGGARSCRRAAPARPTCRCWRPSPATW